MEHFQHLFFNNHELFLSILLFFSDGDPDQKDFCWRFVSSKHIRRCQELFWTVWTRKLNLIDKVTRFDVILPTSENGENQSNISKNDGLTINATAVGIL